jgi:replicative DNA helicase
MFGIGLNVCNTGCILSNLCQIGKATHSIELQELIDLSEREIFDIAEHINRGKQDVINVKDILIACVDGLTGFPEAINAVFPQTDVQLCM